MANHRTVLILTVLAFVLLLMLLSMDAFYLKQSSAIETGGLSGTTASTVPASMAVSPMRTFPPTRTRSQPTLSKPTQTSAFTPSSTPKEPAPNSLEYMLSQMKPKPSDSGSFIYTTSKQTGRRNAICISGTRMYRLTDEAVHQAMVEHVFAHSDPDIFIYGFDKPDNPMNYTTLFQFYGDRLVAFEIGNIAPGTTELEELHYFQHANLQINQHVCYDNLLRPHVRLYRRNNYEVIMKARPDMLYESPVNMTLFATDPYLPEKVFFVPPPHNVWTTGAVTTLPPPEGATRWGNGRLGINDQCMIASPYMMDHLMHTLYGFMEHLSEPDFHEMFREIRLYGYLIEHLKFRALRADFKYTLSRGPGDHGWG